MSAKIDSDTIYMAEPECAAILCEHCNTALTQLFAEVQHSDKEGAYVRCRGYCQKCDKETWSKKLR
jgi:hypothetical protein